MRLRWFYFIPFFGLLKFFIDMIEDGIYGDSKYYTDFKSHPQSFEV